MLFKTKRFPCYAIKQRNIEQVKNYLILIILFNLLKIYMCVDQDVIEKNNERWGC